MNIAEIFRARLHFWLAVEAMLSFARVGVGEPPIFLLDHPGLLRLVDHALI
jgi:hypothetical protein